MNLHDKHLTVMETWMSCERVRLFLLPSFLLPSIHKMRHYGAKECMNAEFMLLFS